MWAYPAGPPTDLDLGDLRPAPGVGGQTQLQGRGLAAFGLAMTPILPDRAAAGGTCRRLLGAFSARVMAASLKAVLDDLLTQFAADPDLDIEAYGTELAALFERAARPDPGAGPAIAPGHAPPI